MFVVKELEPHGWLLEWACNGFGKYIMSSHICSSSYTGSAEVFSNAKRYGVLKNMRNEVFFPCIVNVSVPQHSPFDVMQMLKSWQAPLQSEVLSLRGLHRTGRVIS